MLELHDNIRSVQNGNAFDVSSLNNTDLGSNEALAHEVLVLGFIFAARETKSLEDKRLPS